MRNVQQIYRANSQHWVGNGFLVQPLFSHMDEDRGSDPFLMLDYAAPKDFPADGLERGVGAHPHKGFETVTIAYQGEVEHRDSTGGGGVIGTGDVQWMTAGNGIIHQEFHSEHFSRNGGTFEMVQLWVNLPAKHKSAPARYQHLAKENIPVIALPAQAGTIRLIAGKYQNTQGAAETFTEMNVWDMDLHATQQAELSIPVSHNLLLVVLRGEIRINGEQNARAGELVRFEQQGETFTLQAGTENAKILLLSGVPINEPVAAYGPFVMNTETEIMQAIDDFRSGRFGAIA